MNKDKPIFDPKTNYRIEMQGRIDVEWLESFVDPREISVAETHQMKDVTVVNVHTDQAGIVGLVRRLHGLGITIQQLNIVSARGNTAEDDDQS
jgi:hypothetical protein